MSLSQTSSSLEQHVVEHTYHEHHGLTCNKHMFSPASSRPGGCSTPSRAAVTGPWMGPAVSTDLLSFRCVGGSSWIGGFGLREQANGRKKIVVGLERGTTRSTSHTRRTGAVSVVLLWSTHIFAPFHRYSTETTCVECSTGPPPSTAPPRGGLLSLQKGVSEPPTSR